MTLAFLERNAVLSKSSRYRSRLAGDPRFDGLDAIGIQRKINGALGLGATTLYSCPSGKRARLGRGLVLLHNPTAAGITADLHHVPSGGSAGTTNKMAATITVAANETRLYFDSKIQHVMLTGDSLVINIGSANLNAWMTALEEREEVATWVSGFVGNLTSSDTTLITVAALRTWYLSHVIAYNPSGGGLTLDVNLRESGVAVADSNQIVESLINTVTGFTLNLADSYCGANLGEGGIVSARGSGTGLNVWASGILV